MIESYAAAKSRPVGLHQGAKSLLRNVIRHTDTHNRHLEEAEMWQLHQKLKQENLIDYDDSYKHRRSDSPDHQQRNFSNKEEKSIDIRDPHIQNSYLYDDREDMGGSKRGKKRAHMDDVTVEEEDSKKNRGQSTYWLRQLHNFEEADPERWGHSGFKELYPEVYNSDSSNQGKPIKRKSKHKSSKKKHKKKKMKREHEKSEKKMKKHKKKDKDKKHTSDSKSSHSKHRGGNSSDNSSDYSFEMERIKKKKRYNKVENEKQVTKEDDYKCESLHRKIARKKN